MPAKEALSRFAAVVRVSSGNFVEMYDFIVYGYYAKAIGDAFFPSHNAFASLMASLATFGSGYLMRPLGAVVLGAFLDRHGRRAGLLLTLGLMAIGTATLAFTPSYATIGVAAPIIVVAGRLLQGLSAGVELGGVSIYLAEIAPPGRRGFYTAWQSGSQQVAVMFSALVGVVLSQMMPPGDLNTWGWRIPMVVGCLIVPLIFWLRSSLSETEAFKRQTVRYATAELLAKLGESWKIVGLGAALSILTTTAFYLITAYTPTYGREALHLSAQGNMITTLIVGASNFIWLPIGGALSDRYGRRGLLLAVPLIVIATAYPLMSWLVAAPSFAKLTAVELDSAMFGLYNGAMIPRLAEIVPPRLRTTAFALAFSLATAIFGGFTPAVATYLIHATGNKAAPALWLTLAAVISLGGVLASRRLESSSEDAPELALEPSA